ncbi:MAG TPA: hypothetical protein PK545_02885, partial [Deltaproteobacteria bacterium]|nr:hypothetical protein [Deltaproteobacteria bacterium]
MGGVSARYRDGARDAFPVVLGYTAIGLAFGVVAQTAGFTVAEVAVIGAFLHRWIMMFDPGPIRRPNPLAPSAMTPAERRADLCGLLALGLVRLRM